ncbi:MAG: nucleotide exchange factor GrpE [Acidobacteria bacterium]|nr:nucleotide exchange factor GrpE [Acidobacteriota bacterium]
MTGRKRRDEDDGIIFLETESRDAVAKALEEAERAIEAVEERHRQKLDESAATRVPEAPPEPPAPPVPQPDPRIAAIEAELKAAIDRARRAHDELEGIKERAIRSEEETGRLREALLRKSADFDNLKRRTEKDKADYFKFALADTFHDLLGVLDNFERALAHRGDASSEDFQAGIDMIARQLGESLRKYGLVEVPALGLPFDPNVHEAVVKEETTDTAPGTVLEVFQRGYLLNERLLRPARVKVAGAPGKENGTAKEAALG